MTHCLMPFCPPFNGNSLRLSRISFGAARLYAGSELRNSARLIEAALDAGISHFDTAPVYGNGQSELVLGEVLSGVAYATCATKVGSADLSSERPSIWSAAYRRWLRPVLSRTPAIKRKLLSIRRGGSQSVASKAEKYVLSRDLVRCSVENSLKRLRRDYLDVLLVHEPDQIYIDDELRTVFDDLLREGVIRSYGLGYGQVVASAPSFGSVLQSAYPADFFHSCIKADRQLIWHGVLRTTHTSPKNREPFSPHVAMRKALATNPNASILFSASSPRQIVDLVSGLGRFH